MKRIIRLSDCRKMTKTISLSTSRPEHSSNLNSIKHNACRVSAKKDEGELKNCGFGPNFVPDKSFSSNDESSIVCDKTELREAPVSRRNYVVTESIRSNGMVIGNDVNLDLIKPGSSTSHESYTDDTVPDLIVSSNDNIEIVSSFISSAEIRSLHEQTYDEPEANCSNNFEKTNIKGNICLKKYTKDDSVTMSSDFKTPKPLNDAPRDNMNMMNQNGKRSLNLSEVNSSKTDHCTSGTTITSKSIVAKRIRSPYFTRITRPKTNLHNNTTNIDNVANSKIKPRLNNESNRSEQLKSSQCSQERAQKSRKDENKSKEDVKRTFSFDACWAGDLRKSFPSTKDNRNIKIHTLILGTHPSVKSLSEKKYYAHPLNAFWWIAGDCLGFRRDTGVSSSSKRPYLFTKDLYHKRKSDIISYQKQIETFCNHGFALWDIVRSCQRQGSLDKDIRNEEVNDIRSFCKAHPTIRRIVFSNGQGQCKLFMKHFNDWWAEGDSYFRTPTMNSRTMLNLLIPERNEASKIFGKKYCKRISDYARLDENVDASNILMKFSARKQKLKKLQQRKIVCVCMPGVSPSNAQTSYKTKRDIWKKYCYDPGLRDHEELNILSNEIGTV